MSGMNYFQFICWLHKLSHAEEVPYLPKKKGLFDPEHNRRLKKEAAAGACKGRGGLLMEWHLQSDAFVNVLP